MPGRSCVTCLQHHAKLSSLLARFLLPRLVPKDHRTSSAGDSTHLLVTTVAAQRNNFQFCINSQLHLSFLPRKSFNSRLITRSAQWYTLLLHCPLSPSSSGPSQATSDMPKRVAEEYITKDHGSVANPASGQNQPTMSTAAQLAKRK